MFLLKSLDFIFVIYKSLTIYLKIVKNKIKFIYLEQMKYLFKICVNELQI